jgi:hypothetical protein
MANLYRAPIGGGDSWDKRTCASLDLVGLANDGSSRKPLSAG